MIDCIEQTGRALNLNNEGIVKYLCGIEEERKNLEIIIQKQYQERKRVEAEIERLTYKLCLINKSLSMRIKAKNNYDKTIEEIKGHYERLVDSSNKLRQIVEKTQQELDDIMNKKTGTGPDGGAITMLYVKPDGDLCEESCPCSYTPEVPTREKSVAPVSSSLRSTGLLKASSNGDFKQETSTDEVKGTENSSNVSPIGSTKAGLPEGPMSTTRNKTASPAEISFAGPIPSLNINNPGTSPKKLSIEEQKSKNSPKGSNTTWFEDEDSSKNLLLSRLKSVEKHTKGRLLPVKPNENNSSSAPGTQRTGEDDLPSVKSETSQIL